MMIIFMKSHQQLQLLRIAKPVVITKVIVMEFRSRTIYANSLLLKDHLKKLQSTTQLVAQQDNTDTSNIQENADCSQQQVQLILIQIT